MTHQNIPLKSIRIDGGTQAREELHLDTVAEYRQVLADGGEMPPVTLFFDGAEYWLADGFHRWHAYAGDDRASIPSDVRTGTKRDAILFACGANAHHGLRRTNGDKRKAVAMLLADAECAKLSDRELARKVGVAHTLVSAVRNPQVAQQRDENRRRSAQRQVEPGSTTETPNSAEPDSTIAGGICAAVGAPQFGERPDMGVIVIDAAPPPPSQTEAERIAAEAHGDTDLAALLDETQRELEAALKTIEACEADDTKSEVVRLARRADHAERRQGELMENAAKAQAREKWTMNQLRRCGRAVGEEDPDKIAPTVEAFVRANQREVKA